MESLHFQVPDVCVYTRARQRSVLGLLGKCPTFDSCSCFKKVFLIDGLKIELDLDSIN